ncbi:hypothetical protein LTR05_000916 [Lithohypha guttulata]|uniref:N-acetyltransferase domain-containing protein n=1 Tax=Lithohypha guttulata TaxID=1690604 RepID=A0AAN7T739_9EURO|nr:hypothetical protein LTR05_000916 [Lithohypha guttulata]
MKQGSILTFLQPRPALMALHVKEAETDVQVVETEADSLTDSQEPSEGESDRKDHGEAKRDFASTPSTTCLKDSRTAISKVYPSHIGRLKTITAALLPVRYSDKFYSECLEPDKHATLAFVALYDSKPVGWIRCRLESHPSQENVSYQQIYIQTLGLLAPFRGLGLATELLKTVVDSLRTAEVGPRSIYAHVWERNNDALMWYEKQSFIQVMLQPQYYNRLKPSGAWIVRKELT